MRFIRDIFAAARQARRPAISFEFFPTKTPEGNGRCSRQRSPRWVH
jgi:hypothetical protein